MFTEPTRPGLESTADARSAALIGDGPGGLSDPSRSLRVLVIDDDPDDFFIVAAVLRQGFGRGIEITHVPSLDDPDLPAVVERCDVILLDYQLGARTGLELFEMFEGDRQLPPVIMLTGFDDHSVDEAALEAGAVDFLIKQDLASAQLSRSIRYALKLDRTQREALAATHRLESLFRAVPSLILHLDANSRIIAANQLMGPLLLGVPIAGMPVSEVLIQEAVEALDRELSSDTEAPEIVIEVGALAFKVASRTTRTEAEFVVVFHDITSELKAERTLREIVQQKAAFIGTVSHELRTPLTGVIGNAEILATPGAVEDEATRAAMLHDIAAEAWDLSRIVEDLLVATRLDHGELTADSNRVNTSNDIVQAVESVRRHKAVEVVARTDGDLWARGDSVRVRQIVRNLIVNAVAHGRPPIEIEARRDDDDVVVRVIDHGDGVAPELADQMFEQYESSAGASGTARFGLGLWISRRLAELMGGSLIHRREGARTVFELRLPGLQ